MGDGIHGMEGTRLLVPPEPTANGVHITSVQLHALSHPMVFEMSVSGKLYLGR
jgi:hypothetical protein